MTDHYTVERYDNRDDWLRARLRSIGGSDAAAVVGWSKYCGPLGLYHRKLGGQITEEEPDDADPLEEMREWGHRLEPVVASKFEESTGVALIDPGDFTIYRSTGRPWVHCTLDRDTDGDAIAEIKCAWFAAADEWVSRVPISHQIQAQLGLYVTRKSVCHFACLINGYKFRHLIVKRNDRFIDRLLKRIDDFWHNNIEAGVPPKADDMEDTRRVLQRLHPVGDSDRYIELGGDWRERIEDRDRLKAEAAKALRKVDEIDNQVRQEMGDATVAVLPGGGGGYTWRGDRRRTLRRNKKLKARER
jgi:putative phage-type endonuclease